MTEKESESDWASELPEAWKRQNASQWRLEDPSRPRGILNERARKYLFGTSDIEPGSANERNVRQQIRNWTINTIFDFVVLVGELEERDKRKILNDGWDPNRPQESGEDPPIFKVRDDLPFLITFIYQLYQLDSSGVATDMLEETVRRGIESAHATAGEYATASVNIDVTTGPNLDELENRFSQEGVAAVTEDQAFLLYRAGRISGSEYIDVIEAKNE